MGEPSDDDVPTVTSSADLRRDDEGSGADADDQTIQKAPDAVSAIEAQAARSPLSSPRPAAGLPAVPADKLPPPPAHPLRPRLPSSPNAAGVGPSSSPTGQITPAMRARAPSSTNALARAEPVKNEPAKSDSKSDVRTVQSTRDAGSDAGDEDGDGPRTLESDPPPSEPATSPKAAMMGPSMAPQTPKMPNAPAVPKAPIAKGPLTPSSVKAPAVPPSVRSPMVPSSAKVPPTTKKSPSQPGADADGDGDSITATAPRVPASRIPLSAPKQVEIRTLGDDDDSADETEVKTLAADLGEIVRGARGGTSEADAADDSVTAQAPVPPSTGPGAPGAKVKDKDNDRTAAVIRIGGKSLMPSTSSPAKSGGEGAYDPDEEESITARTLALEGAEYPDDSVTTQSPSVNGLPEPIDGETEGTTKRVRRKPKADPNASEADAPDDSVTAAAPGHLTNMLRVIASPSDGEDETHDGEEAQGHTQVMLNAPVKPPEHSRRSGVPDAPSSESGLRVTGHDHRIAERASLGALGIPQHHSGAMRGAMASDPALGPSPSDRISRAPFAPMPVPQDDKKPPYALVVGIVAAISILIPVLLFIILSQGTADADAPRVTSQPSPDPVGFTGPRPKAKPAPSTTSPVRSTTTGGGPTNRGPFRR